MSLLNLNEMSESEIIKIIKRAIQFKQGLKVNLSNKAIATLFFESSTRTHYSFITAASKLGVKVIDFNHDNSAINKGESFNDTIATFDNFDLDALIIRSEQNYYYEQLKDVTTPIINAGDGNCDHPTQSLLDLMTIYERFGKFESINILICGDIKHSRVASTNYKIMKQLKMNIKLVAPTFFQSKFGEYVNLDDFINTTDVVMLLRTQIERHDNKLEIVNYNEQFGLNKKRLSLMKDESIIMHPGPFNMGVELTQDVLDSKKNYINKQVNNGVYIRMVVLENELCIS